jgi:uncharacterized circularly permuted ATP-grasp superfamily protein
VRIDGYSTDGFWDEMYDAQGQPRPAAWAVLDALASMSSEEFERRRKDAEIAFLTMGITFNVYGDKQGRERIFPFDLIPRVVAADEWKVLEAGLVQRVKALNAFVDDVYHEKRIVKAGVVPAHVIESSKGYLKACEGLDPPRGIWCHVNGIDLIRHSDGRFYVLEDNVRTPSGVSYVLENRQVAKKVMPEVFGRAAIQPVGSYATQLLESLQFLSSERDPTVVVLTPGRYNSAYFEHSFLAQQMGVELVEGSDLVVRDERVFMRTTRGLQRVHVIYSRVNAEFLDPEVFRPESLLGVPGLMRAYHKGHVALANAPGTGVADDKVVYPYVPKMIDFYLDEEPILPNVPTYVCWEQKDREHVLANLSDLVVKAANESGGYGMLIGPHANDGERAEFAQKIREDPRNYIAQPVMSLSRVPTVVDGRVEGRHVDLRPFVLYGRDIWVQPGGLTRVALRKGSLVVNSSQGGGSKDTWVMADESHPKEAPDAQ